MASRQDQADATQAAGTSTALGPGFSPAHFPGDGGEKVFVAGALVVEVVDGDPVQAGLVVAVGKAHFPPVST